MKSVMQNKFSQVQGVQMQRSSFDRSCGYKTTFDAGYLIPFYRDDVMPGDTFNCNVTGFARLATPIYPIMDNMFMDTHFFFVPYRLIWDNSRKFFGEQAAPGDSIDYTIPQTNETVLAKSIADYLGVPVLSGITFNSLYHRAYGLIWNEWFRDQNLQDPVPVATGDGPDTSATDIPQTLLKRGKRHDYFTSCLPWPQKGDAVSLPLGTTAPIIGDGTPLQLSPGSAAGTPETITKDGTATLYATGLSVQTMYVPDGADFGALADLTSATASTVNDLREAFQVQKLLEHDARGGTRYSEIVRNHFGVSFNDVSYRPEFLGGGSTQINISPIATTTDGTRDVGDLGAMGTAQFNNHGFTKSFNEHGIVMGLVSVRADLTYQQGLDRFFSKQTRYDMYWPSLAHLGEQEVLNKEIYAQLTAADEEVFGYQERYAEYRYKPSLITGQFRSGHATTLDSWHLSQEFSSLPTLGDTFIQETPPVDRVIQTPAEPHIIFDSLINLRCARPMPTYATPGMIDHF